MLSRRAFLAWLAGAVPAAALVRRAHAAAIDDLVTERDTLQAIGEAVLPSELTLTGVVASVGLFRHWIAGYREHAELLHGYGTSALAYSGPTPATRWASQLRAIDAAARRRHGRAFAALPLARRRAMVRDELEALKVDRISSVGRAPHVAVALLAHFYASGNATDRCYDAQIGKQSCRPLAASPRRPLPIATRQG